MTATVAVALTPSLVAVSVAEPTLIADTSPMLSVDACTVATVVSLLVQVTMRPVSALPAESAVAAVYRMVPPIGTVAEVGVTVTLATAAIVVSGAAGELWWQPAMSTAQQAAAARRAFGVGTMVELLDPAVVTAAARGAVRLETSSFRTRSDTAINRDAPGRKRTAAPGWARPFTLNDA